MTTSFEMAPLTSEQQPPRISENDIKAEILQLNLPNDLIDCKVKYGVDHDEDPSIFVDAIIENDNIEEEIVKVKYNQKISPRYEKRFKTSSIIHQLVKEKVSRDIFVYVDVSSVSQL